VKRARSLVAAALLAAGCSLQADRSGVLGPVNTCDTPSACGGDGTCVDGRCVATAFDLEGLLVEVRPLANAAFGATTSYLFDPARADIQLRSEGGAPFVARMSPTLPEFVSIRAGRVRVHDKTLLGPTCALGADRAVPAKVTFYRVSPFAGLPLAPVTATTNAAGQLDVDLVPDTYDVYIEPQPVPDCNDGLPFPPVYFAGQSITTGGALTWDLPVVGTLTATIGDFGDAAPAEWKLHLLEPARGLPVSANATVEKPDPAVDLFQIKAQIAWPDGAVPIIRLAPTTTAADEHAAPTAYWTVASFSGTKTDPLVPLTVDQLFGKPVKVGGHVYGSDKFTGVRATLEIHSTALSGPDAKNAVFSVDGIEANDHGEFSFSLPPGTYTLRATPIDNGLRVTDKEMFTVVTVPATSNCFCGQSLELEPKLKLSGAVKTPTGERVAGATLSVSPAQLAPRSYWNAKHALAPLAPRVTSTVTTHDGNFEMLVDLGSADVVVQMAPETGFPWVVRPSLTVDGAALGALVISNPAILSGSVRDPSGMPVANAEVNAWLPVRDATAAKGLARTVVKIATTSTDADGKYTLLMPASL